MADNYKLHIGDENLNKTINYGNFEVQFPKNYTNNSAFIGQHKLTKPDSDNVNIGGSAAFDWNKDNAGKLMSCFEINWGNAIEGWRNDDDHKNTSEKAKNANWNDTDYTFPDRINTSADLLRYIFMLRWKLENIQTAPAKYGLSIPSSLTVPYKSTNQVTATATQSNTTATVSSYTWSLSNNDNNKFSISSGQNTKTVTIKHDETLTSTWELPTKSQASASQPNISTNGTTTLSCTPGIPKKNIPTPSSAKLKCIVTWTDGHTEDNEDKLITINSSGYDDSGTQSGTEPTASGYKWTIMGDDPHATLSDDTAQTCTLIGESAGTVKVKCTVTWTNGLTTETNEVSITVKAPETTYYYSVGTTEVTTSNYTTANNARSVTSISQIPSSLDISSMKGYVYIVLPTYKEPTVKTVDGGLPNILIVATPTGHKVYKVKVGTNATLDIVEAGKSANLIQ